MRPGARALVLSGFAHGLSAPSCPEYTGCSLSSTLFSLFSTWWAQKPSPLPCSVRPGPGPKAHTVAILTSAHVNLPLFLLSDSALTSPKNVFRGTFFFFPFNQKVLPKTSWKIPHYFRNIVLKLGLPLTQRFCPNFRVWISHTHHFIEGMK